MHKRKSKLLPHSPQGIPWGRRQSPQFGVGDRQAPSLTPQRKKKQVAVLRLDGETGPWPSEFSSQWRGAGCGIKDRIYIPGGSKLAPSSPALRWVLLALTAAGGWTSRHTTDPDLGHSQRKRAAVLMPRTLTTASLLLTRSAVHPGTPTSRGD